MDKRLIAWQKSRLKLQNSRWMNQVASTGGVWHSIAPGMAFDPQDAAQITYAHSNAAEEIPLETMAWRKTHRYLIERSNQDSKSELGWDEFQTRKYHAWEHQLALTIFAA